MMSFIRKIKPILSSGILVIFCGLQVCPSPAYAQTFFGLPEPGTMVSLSSRFIPTILQGLRIYPENPLEVDFVIEAGDSSFQGQKLEDEIEKLVQYFLAALTIPEKDIWVNLSPYESDRIATQDLCQTAIGRDLLSQDYLLKQITASLIYPEDQLGREFWDRVYQKTYLEYGTTEIPISTFNKVWIIPEKAVVYETPQGVFIAESHLKVMLEEDYLALSRNLDSKEKGTAFQLVENIEKSSRISSDIVREVVLPEIEKEVNTGENFAKLRQIFHSLILATWFKKALKSSIITSVYADKNKIEGVGLDDKKTADKIYQLYLEAFQKGVYDYIKVEKDSLMKKSIPRKYFSGGFFTSKSDQWMERREGKSISSGLQARKLKKPLIGKIRLSPLWPRSDLSAGTKKAK